MGKRKNKIGFNTQSSHQFSYDYMRAGITAKYYIGDDSPMKVSVLGGDPRIYVTPEAMQKMQAYTRICNNEIGWLGDVKPFGKMCYLITDVFLAEQVVAGTTCNLTDEGLHALYEERLICGEDISNMKLWGHSHVNMGAFASGQDDTELKRFTETAEGFFIRLIMNKKDEFHITFVDTERQIQWTELPITIWVDNVIDEDTIKDEIEQKVTVQVYTAPVYAGRSNARYSYYPAQQQERQSELLAALEEYNWRHY